MKKIFVVFVVLLLGIGTTIFAETPEKDTATPAGVRLESYQKHLQMKEESIFNRLEWRNIGPYFMGGRIVDIEAYEDEPYRYYLATASGGLFVTDNNGTTWTALFDNESSITIGDIAVSQTDKNLIWVGTGEHNSSRSTYAGTGIFKSTDGGKTWKNMGLTDSHHISRVLVDPKNNDIVYAAVIGHLYTYNEERGVFKTTDGGKTWKKVLYISPKTGVIDLAMHPKNNKILLASAWQRKRKAWNFWEGGAESGIYKSSDGGETWKQIDGGLPRHEDVGRIGLDFSRSNPDVVYALLDNQERKDGKKKDKNEPANQNMFNSQIKGVEVYRSNDGGDTWSKANKDYLTYLAFTYGYYFGQIRVAPDNDQVVYILGVPLMKSTDGGKTFKDISQQGGIMGDGGVHADMHALWIDPNDPKRLLLGTDGGLNISYDEGKTWQKFNNISLGQCYTINYDFQEPYYVYTGLQDNGVNAGPSNFVRFNRQSKKNWIRLVGGDGAFVQPEPGNPDTVYVAFQYGAILRLDLTGKSGTRNIKPSPKNKKEKYRFNWLSPFFVSPHNRYALYMGGNKVFRSMDRGEHWTEISPDLTNQTNISGDVPYATIVSLDESPIKPELLYAGTDDGNVWVKKDAQSDWVKINKGLPEKWVTRLVASKYKEERVYITLTGYRDDDFKTYVYVSEDMGSTWTSLKGNLPEEAVNVIREDPVNQNVLYLGTDLGIYVSLDRGKNWHSIRNNLPTNAVYDLRIHPREKELIIGTHGRGVYIMPVSRIQAMAKKIKKETLYIFKVPNVKLSASQYGWQPALRFFYYSNKNRALECSIKDRDGKKIYSFDANAEKGINQLEWNLAVSKKDKKKLIGKGDYVVELKEKKGKANTRKDIAVK
jgi:photosystem II stability/assembly factor-like uncharacterized protein